MMDTSLTLVQCQLVDEHVTFSLAELSRVCGAERELVLQLVEHGVIEPIGPGPQSELFDAVGLLLNAGADRSQGGAAGGDQGARQEAGASSDGRHDRWPDVRMMG